jgi:hypothetical protein
LWSPTGGTSATASNLAAGTYTVNVSNSVAQLLTSAPSGTETAVAVRNIPSGTQAVSGTISTTPTGIYTVVSSGTGTQPVSGTVTATPTGIYTVTNSGTQAVSGTVTATPTGIFNVDTLRMQISTAIGGVSAHILK